MVMDHLQYRKMCTMIVADKSGYRTLDGDSTDVFHGELSTILQYRFDNQLIDRNEFDFLLPTFPRVATFF